MFVLIGFFEGLIVVIHDEFYRAAVKIKDNGTVSNAATLYCARFSKTKTNELSTREMNTRLRVAS